MQLHALHRKAYAKTHRCVMTCCLHPPLPLFCCDKSIALPPSLATTSFSPSLLLCTGYDLLKKKSDALSARLRSLLKEIRDTKAAVGKEMNGATFAISEAAWSAGDFRKKVVETPQRERALVKVRVRTENVAGVKLPVFAFHKEEGGDAELGMLGLASGGRMISKAKEKWSQLLEGLVKLGSLQTSFLTLDEAIKITNR